MEFDPLGGPYYASDGCGRSTLGHFEKSKMAAISLNKFLPIRQGRFIFASIPVIFGSANPLNVFLIPPNYDITKTYNMAAKMAAVPSISLIRYPREIMLVSIPIYCCT